MFLVLKNKFGFWHILLSREFRRYLDFDILMGPYAAWILGLIILHVNIIYDETNNEKRGKNNTTMIFVHLRNSTMLIRKRKLTRTLSNFLSDLLIGAY